MRTRAASPAPAGGARRAVPVAALVSAGVVAVAAAACARGEAATPAPEATKHEVQMRAVAFAPRELTVGVGDTVTWRNVDIVRHNAVRPEVFDTGELRPGTSFDWVPADTGTYAYRCTIHQRMRGRLKVVRRP